MRLAKSEDIARRLRCVRELAGYRSADALAAAMNTPRLSGRTLRDMEKGIGVQGKHPELRHIAWYCRVTFGVFAADLDPRQALIDAAAPLEDNGRHEPTTAELQQADADIGAIVEERAPATAPGTTGRPGRRSRPTDEREGDRPEQPAPAGGRA